MSREIQQRVQCFVFDVGRLLLGTATGRMNDTDGRLVGPDGFVLPKEDLISAVVRVCENDLGIILTLEKKELVARKLYKCNYLDYDVQIDVFVVSGYEGFPVDTKRITDARWYEVGKLPLSRMSEEDQGWIVPAIRDGERFSMEFDSNSPTDNSLTTKVDLVKAASYVPTPV